MYAQSQNCTASKKTIEVPQWEGLCYTLSHQHASHSTLHACIPHKCAFHSHSTHAGMLTQCTFHTMRIPFTFHTSCLHAYTMHIPHFMLVCNNGVIISPLSYKLDIRVCSLTYLHAASVHSRTIL